MGLLSFFGFIEMVCWQVRVPAGRGEAGGGVGRLAGAPETAGRRHQPLHRGWVSPSTQIVTKGTMVLKCSIWNNAVN